MRCLDGALLADLVAQAIAPEAREGLERHLDDCGDCRSLIAAYARTIAEEPEVLDRTLVEVAGRRDRDDPHEGAVLAERFFLERLVGRGGMGTVWAGLDRQTGGRVAIKILHDDAPELTARLRREARVGALLVHPNVLPIRAIVTLPARAPVLIMDLLEGESLASRLAKTGRMSFDALVPLLAPLVDAVRVAHERGVIHRDLKPSNVFLARDDDGVETVILLDFGLAKILGGGSDAAADTITRSGALIGTPSYMAPEQLLGAGAVDARADVWALGAIAYEALAGRRPVEGRSYAQIVRAHATRSIRPLGESAPGVPPDFAALVDRMLSHEPERRPTSIEIQTRLALEHGR
jgi:serine/threonine-protein kinase